MASPHQHQPTTPFSPEQFIGNIDPSELNDCMPIISEGLDLNNNKREEYRQIMSELLDVTVEDVIEIEQFADGIRRRRADMAAAEINQSGFAKIAPRFSDQLTGEPRENIFYYVDNEDANDPQPGDIQQMTESAGLEQLYGFLADFYNDTRHEGGVDKFAELSSRSRSMLENLSFIGEREFREASYGIAAYWKAYLEEDENRQICVMAPVSHSARYTDIRKSDEYFRDRVLQTFTDEELKKYSGRIVGVPEDLTAEPEDAKVILLDDWSISGRELRTAYDEQHINSDAFYKYAAARSVEVNLLISSEGRLERGLKLNPTHGDPDLPSTLPVHSYFQSRYSLDSQQEHKSHVSGTHSSVNYDFDKDINRGFPHAVNRFNRLNRLRHIKECASRIALANIIPPYRDRESEIEITADKLRRRDQS